MSNDSEHVELATYVAAVAFNSAALPANLPAWMKAAIGEKAAALAADPTNPFIMHPPSAREISERRQKDQDSVTRTQLALIAQAQEREREEWAHTNSTVGDVTMTGEGWSKLAERLRDDEDLHRRLIDVFRKRGMSEAEAEAHYDRVADTCGIAHPCSK